MLIARRTRRVTHSITRILAVSAAVLATMVVSAPNASARRCIYYPVGPPGRELDCRVLSVTDATIQYGKAATACIAHNDDYSCYRFVCYNDPLTGERNCPFAVNYGAPLRAVGLAVPYAQYVVACLLHEDQC
jgi:hypothetical protein